MLYFVILFSVWLSSWYRFSHLLTCCRLHIFIIHCRILSFNDCIEFEEVDDATLDVFRQQFAMDLVNMPNAFKMLGLEDYLKLAGRISRYAVNL
jgi:hypothetical protein